LTAVKAQCGDEEGFRRKVRPILRQILKENPGNLVLAMPPGGMFREYRRVYDRHPDVVTIWITDRAKNIFKRLIFTDNDDQLIQEPVVAKESAWWYLSEVREDKRYFRDTLRKAHVKFDVAGRDAHKAAAALLELLTARSRVIQKLEAVNRPRVSKTEQ